MICISHQLCLHQALRQKQNLKKWLLFVLRLQMMHGIGTKMHNAWTLKFKHLCCNIHLWCLCCKFKHMSAFVRFANKQKFAEKVLIKLIFICESMNAPLNLLEIAWRKNHTVRAKSHLEVTLLMWKQPFRSWSVEFEEEFLSDHLEVRCVRRPMGLCPGAKYPRRARKFPVVFRDGYHISVIIFCYLCFSN